MKEPGPDHPITITPNPKRIRVTLGGVVAAESARVLDLKEASYPAVHYVPRADIVVDLYQSTDRSSHCPYKGDASYFTISAGGEVRRDAAWCYETPFPAVAAIAGHLAFYPDKVTIEELS